MLNPHRFAVQIGPEQTGQILGVKQYHVEPAVQSTAFDGGYYKRGWTHEAFAEVDGNHRNGSQDERPFDKNADGALPPEKYDL